MRHLSLACALAGTLAIWSVAPAAAQGDDGAPGPYVPVAAAELEWSPIEVPGFPSGMQITPIMGNPEAEGEPYTLRLKFPDGYRFPPHWHPMAENVTVLSGTFLLALGEQADESRVRTYRPGDYIFIEAEHPHYGGATGETVIQLHGIGPFEIIVVGSDEDRQRRGG